METPPRDQDRITLHPLAQGEEIRIQIRPAPSAPDHADQIKLLWNELTHANPRLYDGPVLYVDPTSLDRRDPWAYVGGYKQLVTAPALGHTVRALGVQGLTIGHDAQGHQHVLLGRRGANVRIYTGLWENAPSGTIAGMKNAGQETLTLPDFVHGLSLEASEELGLNIQTATTRPLTWVEDAQASSMDLLIELTLAETINPNMRPCATADEFRWEYADVAWVPVQAVQTWAKTNTHAISPPTHVVLKRFFI